MSTVRRAIWWSVAITILVSSSTATTGAQRPPVQDGGRQGRGTIGGGPSDRLERRVPGLPGRGAGAPREPVMARGHDDGYLRGLRDARAGARYDPVASRDYRDGDIGYSRGYTGTRDDYRSSYRAGFRQGYEAGYRDGARSGPR